MSEFSENRPNVLLILVDQLRYDAFSHMGNQVIETPNIDRLAAGGVVFTDATCSSPVCGPSRASLLTGCFAFDGKFVHQNREPDKPGPWLQELVTVDEALSDLGMHVEYYLLPFRRLVEFVKIDCPLAQKQFLCLQLW